MIKRTAWQKLVHLGGVMCAGAIGFSTICIYKGDSGFYKNILMPALQLSLDGESAHRLSVLVAKYKLLPSTKLKKFETSLVTEFCGINLEHPVGLAAGFDKDGEAVEGLNKIGFSFIEIGSVTPLPQPGNPKKRVFRLSEDEAVINRYGFNSAGHDVVLANLTELRKTNGKKIILGVNLGKNKTSADAIADYVAGVKLFAHIADYLVINISSPNTPGLRSLQGRDELIKLISGVLKSRNDLKVERKTPILLKIAPDLHGQDLVDVADVVTNNPECRVDGLIVSNTTISRPETLQSKFRDEVGGLSGKPLRNLSDETIKEMYRLTKGKIPIIGVGGISSGEDAYRKILLGASAVQVYTALVYQGPPLISSICYELDECLKNDGYSSVKDAVGAFHRQK